MNAMDFIISGLRELSSKFNGISIKYAFDNTLNYHIIEISPESIRRGDEQYIEWEADMWNSFFTKFPNDDLLISEPCASNDMRNLLFEKSSFQGDDFYTYNISFSGEDEGIYSSSINYLNLAS